LSIRDGDAPVLSDPRHIVWQSLPTLGFEHLTLRQDDEAVFFESVVFDVGPPSFRAWYEIETDADWRVRQCLVRLLGEPERMVVLQSDYPGRWTDGAGHPLPTLDGCIDVDLTATPSTNTLPIRRLGLQSGESADITVAWVQFPDLSVTPSPQRYTCLERRADGGTYRFVAVHDGFTADLPVDADGFVLDYGDLWRRIR
jgi:hypothetical protein